MHKINNWDYVGGHNLHYTFLSQSMSQKDIVWNYKSTNLDIQNTNTLYFDEDSLIPNPNTNQCIEMFGTYDFTYSWMFYNMRIAYQYLYNANNDDIPWCAETNDFSALFELGKENPHPTKLYLELSYYTKRVQRHSSVGDYSRDYRNGFVFYPIVIEDGKGGGFCLGFHLDFGRINPDNATTSSCLGIFRSFCSAEKLDHYDFMNDMIDNGDESYFFGWNSGLGKYSSHNVGIWITYDGLFHYGIYSGINGRVIATGSTPEDYRKLFAQILNNQNYTVKSYMGCNVVNNQYTNTDVVETLDPALDGQPTIYVKTNYGLERWEYMNNVSGLKEDDITYL